MPPRGWPSQAHAAPLPRCRLSSATSAHCDWRKSEREVEQLIEGCKGNRRSHRDQTMILLAFRHGLRASELMRPAMDAG